MCLTLAGPAEALATAVASDYRPQGRPIIHQITEDSRFTLDQAVDKVRAMYGGRIIKARTLRQDGRIVHILKILFDDGRVQTVRVDGISGQIL